MLVFRIGLSMRTNFFTISDKSFVTLNRKKRGSLSNWYISCVWFSIYPARHRLQKPFVVFLYAIYTFSDESNLSHIDIPRLCILAFCTKARKMQSDQKTKHSTATNYRFVLRSIIKCEIQ